MPKIPIHLAPRGAALVRMTASGEFASADAYHLQLLASRLSLITGFDELICLEGLNFNAFDYQVRAAQTALRRFRGRGLLCDEVGLGKTIEAGLVVKEYLLRGMVERVLILTPPGLVEQWRDELSSKFGLSDFASTADPEFRAMGLEAWARHPRLIASLSTARLAKHREAITGLVYDLVVVDEAHSLKNRNSVSWKLVNSLQKKYILLLTATPVQNNLEELYNMITILKPGHLRTPRQFRSQFVAEGEDPRLPKNRGRLRELLADVMVRHSRGQVDVKLPPRRAHTVRLQLAPEERSLYDEVSALVRSRLVAAEPKSEAETNGRVLGPGEDVVGIGSTLRFTMGVLQREIGSSPAAAHATLLKLAEREHLPGHRQELLELAGRALQVGRWAKAEALEQLLPGLLANASERVIIFTQYRPTLERLADRLRAKQVEFALYHGGLPAQEKDAAIDRFERQAPVLLSTEAAGEGRNLQFCRIMVNFDLPWNPMRIEQRIGRIHRIGQRRPVEIYNLTARGTIEDYILDILDRKINMFELVIGEVDMILGQLDDQRDFEDLVMQVWTQASDEVQVTAGMERLGDALAEARAALRRAQELDESLFGEDFAAGG